MVSFSLSAFHLDFRMKAGENEVTQRKKRKRNRERKRKKKRFCSRNSPNNNAHFLQALLCRLVPRCFLRISASTSIKFAVNRDFDIPDRRRLRAFKEHISRRHVHVHVPISAHGIPVRINPLDLRVRLLQMLIEQRQMAYGRHVHEVAWLRVRRMGRGRGGHSECGGRRAGRGAKCTLERVGERREAMVPAGDVICS
jgi:hypothetical protein